MAILLLPRAAGAHALLGQAETPTVSRTGSLRFTAHSCISSRNAHWLRGLEFVQRRRPESNGVNGFAVRAAARPLAYRGGSRWRLVLSGYPRSPSVGQSLGRASLTHPTEHFDSSRAMRPVLSTRAIEICRSPSSGGLGSCRPALSRIGPSAACRAPRRVCGEWSRDRGVARRADRARQ